MKGQLSAEMLIIIAVVLAVVAIVGMQLISTGEKTSAKIEERSTDILEKTDGYLLAKEGAGCDDTHKCAADLSCSGPSVGSYSNSCTK